MSFSINSILNDFEICARIPQSVRVKIKSFHVFNDYFEKKNLIFITKRDKVYCLGENINGGLGLGHDSKVEECTEIKELSNKKINEFFTGRVHVLALSPDKGIFTWGKNQYGQLGLGVINESSYCLKPSRVQFLKNEMIADICCGFFHTLVLLSDGRLYGWGDNRYGELGLNKQVVIDKPVQVDLCGDISNLRFKYIYCFYSSSYAITTNGLLYSWGQNRSGRLGHEVVDSYSSPRLVNLFNVQKICANVSNSYFLTNEGSIYFCGNYEQNNKIKIQTTPKRMSDMTSTIHDLCRSTNYPGDEAFCCDSDNFFCKFVNNKFEILDRQYESFNELYAIHFGITPQTLHMTDQGDIENSIELANEEHVIKGKDLQFRSLIGSGGFGTVGKYWNTSDKVFYAVKAINTENSQNLPKETLREVETMAKLKSRFVVRYNNSWIENNTLFIQMEYCFDNLRNVLIVKPLVFKRSENQAMNSTEYYISCEIFRQITEALNYLHSLKPEPLIHRDLKPDNILIGMSGNKRSCKLADFGLSKFIDEHSDYHTMVGATHKYRAPDIGSGHKYDTKIDVWSLGIIGLEIFNLDKPDEVAEDHSFMKMMLSDLIAQKLDRCDKVISSKLLTAKRSKRICCSELLIEISKWKIPRSKDRLDAYQQKFTDMNLDYFRDILALEL